MNRYYNIGYTLLHLLLTPVVLRNKMQMAMTIALGRAMDALHVEFLAYARSLEISVKAQVCYLQALLNDEFDFYQRRIVVRPVDIDFDYYLLWREYQIKPVTLTTESSPGFVPYMLGRDFQTGANSLDFEAVLPMLWLMSAAEEARLRNVINANKLASKKYRIVYE